MESSKLNYFFRQGGSWSRVKMTFIHHAMQYLFIAGIQTALYPKRYDLFFFSQPFSSRRLTLLRTFRRCSSLRAAVLVQ